MNSEQQRQINIDADIDEVIKTIQGLRLKFDEKTTATDTCSEIPSRRRNRWLRWAVVKIPVFAIGAFAGFVSGYNLHPSNGANDILIDRLPEIRRAIPVEVRRAIPVHPEIRKAVPVRSGRNSTTQHAPGRSHPGEEWLDRADLVD